MHTCTLKFVYTYKQGQRWPFLTPVQCGSLYNPQYNNFIQYLLCWLLLYLPTILTYNYLIPTNVS